MDKILNSEINGFMSSFLKFKTLLSSCLVTGCDGKADNINNFEKYCFTRWFYRENYVKLHLFRVSAEESNIYRIEWHFTFMQKYWYLRLFKKLTPPTLNSLKRQQFAPNFSILLFIPISVKPNHKDFPNEVVDNISNFVPEILGWLVLDA